MHRTDALTGTDRMRFFKSYLQENPKIRDNWKRWAKKVITKTNRRLLKRKARFLT